MTLADVSVIVCTYQRPNHLRRCLESIAKQKCPDYAYEVIVADDGSEDETSNLVREFSCQVDFRVKFTTHPHEGFQLCKTRNEGVRASHSPYLLFVDGDCLLPPDHLQAHLNQRRKNTTLAGWAVFLDEETSNRISLEEIGTHAYLNWIPDNKLRVIRKKYWKSLFYNFIRHPSKPKLTGLNLGIWREDFDRINGFDENFRGWGNEDDDMCQRLRRAGVKIAPVFPWIWTVHLWHPLTPSFPKSWKEGTNVSYFKRPGRLRRCRKGLVERSLEDISIGQIGQPERPEAASRILNGKQFGTKGDHEVEILFLPGKGRFSGKADCNILVRLEGNALKKGTHILVSNLPHLQIPKDRTFPLSQFDLALEAIT